MTQKQEGPRPVIALGTFDGLHPGHRKVIGTCVELARELGVPAAVYTFLENPRCLFGKAPLPLMTGEEKTASLKKLGIATVYAVHFTPSLCALSPEEFLSLLIDEYHPAALVAGEDYTFGRYACGDSRLLEELCAKRNILCRIIPLVRDPETGRAYSSTRIRDALENGDEQLARKLQQGTEADS